MYRFAYKHAEAVLAVSILDLAIGQSAFVVLGSVVI